MRYRVLGTEAVVVRQNAAEVLALNELGARVLELVDATTSIDGLVDILESEYDVARETLALDVSEFLSELTRLGVVEEVSDAPASRDSSGE